MAYTIGAAAELLGLPTSTLRYYDSQGLIPTLGRTESGRRRFSEQDLEACRVIECLKRSGLSIKEIKDFMVMVSEGDATLADRLALFQGRREVVQRELRELETVLAVLDYKTWYYDTAVAAGSEDAVRSLPESEVGPEHGRARAHLSGWPLPTDPSAPVAVEPLPGSGGQ